METSQSVFLEPRSISNKLGRLIQYQLSRTNPSRCPTIHDLKTMIDTLSTLASTCATVLADITTQGQESDPFSALKELENVLTWNEC